jgi:hypothetical protein
MENLKKHLVLKILLALFPALLFTQNYSWMTANNKIGIGFIVIWAILIWSAWKFNEKNHIIERYFRLSEIALFLLPISAIILTFVIGSQAINSTSDSFAQAGAAVGTAIGGTFIVIISFIIGIVGGIIMHLITNRYEKKAEKSEISQEENFSNKHGLIITVLGVFILAIILGNIREEKIVDNKKDNNPNQTVNTQLDNSQKNNEPVEQEKIKENEVDIKINSKDFIEGDFSSRITMDLEFTNKINRDIRGVEGLLTIYDIFDNEIKNVKVAYDQSIPKNSSKIWDTGLDYNQFMDEDVKLKDTNLEDLNYKWDVSKVVYVDEVQWQSNQNEKVNLAVEEKGYFEGDFLDQITMKLKFINNTGKDIKGIEGVVIFYDIFDNEIKTLDISYDKGVEVDVPKIWDAGFDYNQFMSEDIKLKNTDLKNLKYDWAIKTVVLIDGSKENY